MDINEYDLYEAEVKDEILKYCQGPPVVDSINPLKLYIGPLKGRADQDKIRYYLNKIANDGYFEASLQSPINFKYDFSTERFLLKGGYIKEYYER